MKDVAYVIGEVSSRREELRYSLRSICANCNVKRVFIVGYKPRWLSDEAVFVPCEDKYEGYKHRNILNCLNVLCETTDIDNEFLYSSDDHFYIKKTDFDTYPIYVKNTIEGSIGRRSKATNYCKSLIDTREVLNKYGLTSWNFSWHGNTWFFKDAFSTNREIVEYAISKEYGAEPTCLMLNMVYDRIKNRIVERSDLKIVLSGIKKFPDDLGDRECFSVDDGLFEQKVYGWLKEKFTEMCKFEA